MFIAPMNLTFKRVLVSAFASRMFVLSSTTLKAGYGFCFCSMELVRGLSAGFVSASIYG